MTSCSLPLTRVLFLRRFELRLNAHSCTMRLREDGAPDFAPGPLVLSPVQGVEKRRTGLLTPSLLPLACIESTM
jgi:hypothetical protein